MPCLGMNSSGTLAVLLGFWAVLKRLPGWVGAGPHPRAVSSAGTGKFGSLCTEPSASDHVSSSPSSRVYK